jgi:outer membrane lipoprotein-sorting protein
VASLAVDPVSDAQVLSQLTAPVRIMVGMTLLARRPTLRWLVPLVAAVLLATAGAAVSAFSASARDSLQPRSAAQLLVDVQKAKVDGLSGTVVQTADLGLPALPNAAGGSSSDFSALVSGSHTLRLWYAGPSKARLALLGTLGESDLIRNGQDVWLWASSTNSARHFAVPATADTPDPAGGGTPEAPMTPQQAADQALAAITPTTTVTTDPTATVAGRPAYQLVLEPKDTSTLVGTVRIAIDGATHIPTRVQVFPRGSSTPAFEVGFTSFDPTTPDDSVFAFNPPPGATVTEGLGGLAGQGDDSTTEHGTDSGTQPGTEDSAASKPTVVGDGWTSVVIATLPADSGSDKASSGPLGSYGSVIDKLPDVSGAWGTGHVLHGKLFSVLVTDDGRVAVGAVAPEALYAALLAS